MKGSIIVPLEAEWLAGWPHKLGWQRGLFHYSRRSQAWVQRKCRRSCRPNTRLRSPTTVVYGKQRAANKLFGKWDDSFDWLYRFKAEVEMRSPGTIVEIATEEVDGKIHFNRFFCCFKAAIDGFRNGCRP